MPACGQVSWLSDRPTPHAFPARADPSQWLIVGFVPDYSDGVAADSHRLPWGPRSAGRPDTVNAVTLTERDCRVKQGTPPLFWRLPCNRRRACAKCEHRLFDVHVSHGPPLRTGSLLNPSMEPRRRRRGNLTRKHLPDLSAPQLSRVLTRLRRHGLVKKIGHRYKYYLTTLGRRVATTALKLRELASSRRSLTRYPPDSYRQA